MIYEWILIESIQLVKEIQDQALPKKKVFSLPSWRVGLT